MNTMPNSRQRRKILLHRPMVVCAEILTGEGDSGLREGIRDVIGKILEVERERRACDGVFAERVDAALDEHVGNGEDRALNARRNADMQNTQEWFLFDTHAAKAEREIVVAADEVRDDHDRAEHVGDDRCDRDAGDAELHHDDKEQIEHHVDRAGEQQVVHGTAASP